jgi:hypothetical protein
MLESARRLASPIKGGIEASPGFVRTVDQARRPVTRCPTALLSGDDRPSAGAPACTKSQERQGPDRKGWRCGEPLGVAQAPQTLTLKSNRDRRNWWQSPWIRRALLVVPSALVVLALLNVFGQRMVTALAISPEATLSVTAPERARSGLIYAARFRVAAVTDVKKATLVLDQGWADGYTVNGQAPQPLTQGSSNGRLVYGLGHIPARHTLAFWLSLQVNPTTVGRHFQSVRLYDGHKLLATVRRSVFVFP